MSVAVARAAAPVAIRRTRPPGWLFVATGLLTLMILAMAVAETSLWMHYLIDGGEFVSLAGLGFILAAGVLLFRRGRLFASMPLALPWLLFPVITQGDQLIDNLSINPMRLITHVLLGAIFATPVAVAVLAARYALAGRHNRSEARLLRSLPGLSHLAAGREREGTALLAVTLFVLEMWVAVQYLGTLMVITLIGMSVVMLYYGAAGTRTVGEAGLRSGRRSEQVALALLIGGVTLSLGLYVAFKNRPGAYQGSPSYYMDPAQKGVGYDLGAVPVPAGTPSLPEDSATVRQAFTGYGATLQRLLAGYHIVDRNYTYDFHNELFLRYTPLVPNYRQVALSAIDEARRMRADADQRAAAAVASLAPGDPLRAALEDVRAYVAFNFERAALLEQMSAEFEKTKAGLQHAAHIYEGEGKVLGLHLRDLVEKHHGVFASPTVAPVTSEFVAAANAIYQAYASRIVGF